MLGGKHLKRKLLEMAAKIVASFNEMMKYSPTAYCTLHIFTLLYVIQREKRSEMLSQLQLHTAIGTLNASESGLDDYH